MPINKAIFREADGMIQKGASKTLESYSSAAPCVTPSFLEMSIYSRSSSSYSPHIILNDSSSSTSGGDGDGGGGFIYNSYHCPRALLGSLYIDGQAL